MDTYEHKKAAAFTAQVNSAKGITLSSTCSWLDHPVLGQFNETFNRQEQMHTLFSDKVYNIGVFFRLVFTMPLPNGLS